MISNKTQWLNVLLLTLIAVCLVTVSPAAVPEKDVPDLEKIPTEIMNALLVKFPKAVIHKWTQEKEGDIVIYDIEFQQEGQKFEADEWF